MKLLMLTTIVLTSLISCGQSRTLFGEEFAKDRLEKSLKEKDLHNVVDNAREIIPDSATAVSVSEAILFKIYGEDKIRRQRPYEIYKVKNYWSLSGTLPSNMLGGTFLIILDARDARVIRITHGK